MLSTKQEKTLLIILILVGIFTLFFRLGDRSLENQDRILYTEVAREMVQSGDWIVMRRNGETYLHKPPLLIWLIAVPARIYGAVTPFIARLPSAVSALLGMVIIFFLGKQIYRSALAGFLSGLILLSCYSYSWHARAAQTDMLLCLFIVLSLFLFYTSYNAQEKNKRLLYFLLFCASVGLGVMVKGPNGFLFPVFSAAGFLAYKRDLKAYYKLPCLFGIIVFAIVVLPWPIMLSIKLGGFANALTELQESDIFTRKEAVYFYLIEVPKRFFPWSVFLPATFFYLFSRRAAWTNSPIRTSTKSDHFFPLIWFVTMFVILSIPTCKNPRYMLPAYPALALMVGGVWDWVLNTKNHVSEKWLKYTILASLIILSIVQVAAPVFFLFKYQYLFPGSLCLSIFFLSTIVLLYYYRRAEIYRWSFVVITAFYILAQAIHVHALLVEDAHHSPGRDLAGSVSTYVKGDELMAYNLPVRYLEPINFYMNRVLTVLDKQEDIPVVLAHDKSRYLIMQISDYQSLDEDIKAVARTEKEVLYKDQRLVIISNRQ